MKNFVQPGHALAVVAPSGGLVSGQAVLMGNLFGVAAYSAFAGASAEIVVTGVFTLPKASGVTFTAGAKAYWDNTAFDITSSVERKFVGWPRDRRLGRQRRRDRRRAAQRVRPIACSERGF